MMSAHRRVVVVLVAVGLLAGWSRADSGDEAAQQARRDQAGRSRVLLAEALARVESDSLKAAVSGLRAMLTDDPDNADAHFHLGRIFLLQGDPQEAMAVLEQGVERNPLSRRLTLLLARTKITQESPDEATRMLEGVLTLRPRDGETLYLLGLAQLAAGDSASVLTTWRQAFENSDGGE